MKMNYEEARKMVEGEEYVVLDWTEEDGVYFFTCKGEEDTEIEVCVIDGHVVVSPT